MKTRWTGLVVLLGALAGCSVPGGGPSAQSDNGRGSEPSATPVERQAMRPVVPEQLKSEPPARPTEAAEQPRPAEQPRADAKRAEGDRGAASLPPQLPPSPPAGGPEGGEAPSNVAGINFANSLSEVFHDSASRVLPAVVTIQTAQAAEDEEMDPFLREFFGDRGGRRLQQSLGSGVIIDPSGVILTNYHVVRGEGTTLIRLHDGRQFAAAAIRGDPHTDLAVVTLANARDLPFAKLGDSERLRVGDWIVAVGNPFGLEATVTAGIISAKGRGLGISPREEFLQSDAAINPGNSGGPMVNLHGEVVGINTAISSRSGGYEGIGFAIPVNLAKWVSRQLIEHGQVRWAYLGVGVQTITPQLAERAGLAGAEGLLVREVRPDSPAAKAGVRRGDLIRRFDDKPVAQPRQLQSAVERSEIGSQHTLEIVRNGKPSSLAVTIQQQPAESTAARDAQPRPADRSRR